VIENIREIFPEDSWLAADCSPQSAKLSSHRRAVEAAMLFLKAAGFSLKSSYSRERFYGPVITSS
jgi:hypothetical protein